MRIGELAAKVGVPTPTVRYYERRGLLAEASRTAAGYRQYGDDAVRRLRFIRHAQELGFSLEDVQALLDLRASDSSACVRVAAATREKIRSVRQRLAELRHLERTLGALVSACERHPLADPCPVLAVLSEEAAAPGGRRLTDARRPNGAGRTSRTTAHA